MGIPPGIWSGSDSINELRRNIKEFNESSSKQTVDHFDPGYCSLNYFDAHWFNCTDI